MDKIIVNVDSIKEFGEQMIGHNNNLINVINEMYEDSIKYQEMVNNKTGNLYKEVMLNVLTKEKEIINDNNDRIKNIFTGITTAYENEYKDISNSVRG